MPLNPPLASAGQRSEYATGRLSATYLEDIATLLDAGADPNAKSSTTGAPPLHYAARSLSDLPQCGTVTH